MPKENTFYALLVDDDATDRELFIDAVNLSGKSYRITEASNGEEAINFLSTTTHLPHLIILDLNMPIKDGRETLKEIKSNSNFKGIPVCIMSTSSATFDIINSYDSGANLFITKPHDFTSIKEMLSSLFILFENYVSTVSVNK